MSSGRCPLHCQTCGSFSRRDFLKGSTVVLAGSSLVAGCSSVGSKKTTQEPIRQCGPASVYVPTIRAAFVRRREEYGMLWPGAVYDGDAARRTYAAELTRTASRLGARLELRPEPIYSLEEGQVWIAQAETAGVDGLMLVILDRQQHSWPTAQKAAASTIPSVLFSPLGTSFTTNTIHVADTPGCVVYATNDFSQPAYGMKMLCAKAKMAQTRCVVIKGDRRFDAALADTGISLRHIPAASFIEEYRRTPDSEAILAMADEYMRRARRRIDATRQDVVNGLKSYHVAGRLLEREGGDAITMDCLGVLGPIDVSLPCIAWSRMNDDGIPAACEADVGAVASLVMTHYLFDRPGFQQDPVADTSDDTVIGAHCSCPTRLSGFDQRPEPFDIKHHHGNRDAVPRTLWRKGQRVTSIDVLPGSGHNPSTVLISVGTVTDNMEVPPSGGCVVSVKVKFDGDHPVLSFPGFHQVFFYGDYGREVRDFCRLCGFIAQMA
ncbi:MAG: twin-arginine translocation signal domain-containing protein [Sedimentisphaerales bacterium]|mgnify:CR=1 FL=1|nr:twin-arginine translocation signal domain-containing protein [Sedimentisphaerales bacterium]